MRLRYVLLLAVLACGAYLAAEAFLLSGDFGLPLDDSWIHLQFARNLAQGNGLSYDGARLVTGSTAPLWTALLAPLLLLPGSAAMWVKLLGATLFLAGVHATYRLAEELGIERRLALVAAALTALSSWLVWSALSGMEICLFIVASLWGMILSGREMRDPSRPPASFLVLGLAALARPEGLLLLVLAAGDRCLGIVGTNDRGREERARATRRLLQGLGVALLVVAPVMIFHQVIGGTVFPTTLAAKSDGLQRWLPSGRYVYSVMGIFFPSQPFMTLLAGAGVVVMARRKILDASENLLPALWLVALPLAYSTLSPLGAGLLAGNFGRYFFPLFPPLIVLGTLGLQEVLRLPGREGERPRTARLIHAVALAVLFLPTIWTLVSGAEKYARTVANVQDSDVAMARWLRDRLPPEAVLAVNDVGAIGYLLPNQLLDLAGLVTPEAATAARAAIDRGESREAGLADYLQREQPDYLAVFPNWFPGLTAAGGPLEPIHRIAIPGNITMGGDEIVLYRTPWTRYPLVEPSAPMGP